MHVVDRVVWETSEAFMSILSIQYHATEVIGS